MSVIRKECANEECATTSRGVSSVSVIPAMC